MRSVVNNGFYIKRLFTRPNGNGMQPSRYGSVSIRNYVVSKNSDLVNNLSGAVDFNNMVTSQDKSVIILAKRNVQGIRR